jgi:PmbA protein
MTTTSASTATDLVELCRSIASEAQPGEAIEAYASRSGETDITIFGGEVESLTTAESQGVGIRVVAGGSQGFAWVASLDADLVAETLAEARDNARYAEPEAWYGLPTLDDVGDVIPPVLDLWDDALVSVDTDTKVAYALALEQRVRHADPRIRGVESCSYGDGRIEAALVCSTGVEAAVRRTITSAHASAIADDGTSTQTGFGVSAGRGFEDLDADLIVARAIERSTRLLGATQPATRRLPVLFDPLVTASLLGVLGGAFNGEAALKGRSLFLDRVGEQIAADVVDIADDPTDPRSLGAATHDAEGVPTRRNPLIARGVMHGFLHNTMTARRAGNGTRTTASAARGGYRGTPGVGVRALRIEPGTDTPEQLMARFPEALYVQAVHGLHSGTNPISGDFSVGAEGLMVRDGAYAEPVREITIASTLPRMLLDVTAVGSDQTYLPGGTAGLTLLIGDMTMSGR